MGLEDRFRRSRRRMLQRDIYPTAVKGRILGEDVVRQTPLIIGTASNVPNGNEVLATFTVNRGDALLDGNIELSVYVGSVSASNQLPGGSSIDETEWKVISPWQDWGASDGNNLVFKHYVLNVSAGTSDLIYRAQIRFVSNVTDESVSAGLSS